MVRAEQSDQRLGDDPPADRSEVETVGHGFGFGEDVVPERGARRERGVDVADLGQLADAQRSTPIARATAWPEGSRQVSSRRRFRCGSTVGLVWVCGAIAGTGRVKSTLEIVVSIFLLFFTCPSPRSKKVCQPT